MNARRIVVERTGKVLAESAATARSRRERTKGLLGRPPLRPGEGLLLEPAPQVHTFGMGYPIDVVFCDRSWVVRHVVRGLRPRRLTRWVFRARYALELPAGAAGPDLDRGDRLLVEHPGGDR